MDDHIDHDAQVISSEEASPEVTELTAEELHAAAGGPTIMNE